MATTEVTWDGKDLAVIQAATSHIPRTAGRPCAEVDADWNLTLGGTPVPAGSRIRIIGDQWEFTYGQDESP